jgi:pyruvate,water dikinase
MIENNPEIASLIERADTTDDFEKLLDLSIKLQKAIAGYEMPEQLQKEILDGYTNLSRRIGSCAYGFAVRSSATIEDRSDISFAGQAESYLCCMTEADVIDSVKQVWQSAYSERAVIYLKTKKVPIKQVKMAVIIQEMMAADVSGVMFTANVVNNNTDEMLINATWGFGDSLVSGKVVPDTFILSKNPLKIVQKNLGKKELTSQLESNHQVLAPTSRKMQTVYSLDDRTLLDIAEVGMKIESSMESPQDIEWCIRSDNSLAIIQSRPITTLKSPSSDEG